MSVEDSQLTSAFASELFDDLLEIVHPAGGSLTQNHEPIHLDFPGSVITLFLDHISTSNSSIPIMTVTEIASLLIFAEFAICDSLIDKARARLIGATKECPFELLVLASDRDDIELAKDALRVMMSIHYHHEFNISGPHEFVYNHKNVKIVNYLQRLSLAFRFALREASRRAMEIRGSKYVDGMPGRYLVDHWANTLADDFEFTKYTRAIPPIHRPVQTIYFWTQ
uniref:BTB domain-containing protein n=1 Tax=Kwoniella dejecticola CBS 10117 TaxID=1296121 RepID=A0A1A6AFZ1_9TREE|nr:uncharacterized protein I303_00805 [Kwoniella dejecticola CBS 10117]OBR88985.1 hypothetical protein I303_00805 [Kwoniella dejecticola CBS 10117]